MSGRTTININSNTTYDNATLDDDLFNISIDATLVLLGFDALNDDAVSGLGHVSVQGLTTIDDRLLLSGATLFVNLSTLTQDGTAVAVGLSSADAVTARNTGSATWELENGAGITGAGTSEFVNFGLLDQIDGTSTVDTNFYDRGGVIDVNGVLVFASPGDVNRFVNDKIEGVGAFELNGGVLVSSRISALETDLTGTRIVGNVHVSSQDFAGDDITLGAGSVLNLANSAATITFTGKITGAGTINIRGDDTVTAETVLVGDVTLANYGNLEFGSYGPNLTLAPWTGDTITIENEAGATWDDGYGVFSQTRPEGNSVFINNGTFIQGGRSVALFGIPIVNNGVMETEEGSLLGYGDSSLNFAGAITGSGSVEIGSQSVAVGASVAAGQSFDFNPFAPGDSRGAPTLLLDDPQDFAATITSFDQNSTDDKIELNSTASGPWQLQGYDNGALMFSNGSATAAITLAGAYNAADFHTSIAGQITTVTYG